MPVSNLLELNPFTQEIDELIRELNDRIRDYNDYHRDAETEGLPVFIGPNGFTTSLDNDPSTVTGGTTLDDTYFVVLVDASSAAVTITLPAAATNAGRSYHIKKIDSTSNAVTIDGNASETIDGETTQVFSIQWTSLHVYCNGTSWFII